MKLAFLRRALLVLGGAMYVALLHLAYVHLIAPIYAYLGYRYDHPGVPTIVIAGGLALLPLLAMPISIRRPSQVAYWVLYLIVFVPCMLVPHYAVSDAPGLWTFVLVVFGCFVLLGACYLIPTATIWRPRLAPPLFWGFVAAVSAASYAMIFARFGFSIRVVALTDVYDLRHAYRDDLEANGRLVAYAMAWQANVLNPLIIGYGLIRRRSALVVAGFLGQVALFSITGMKSVLFSTALIVLLNVAFWLKGRWFGLFAAWGAMLVVLLSSLVDQVQNSTLMVSLFVRRLIITSGLLTGWYFDFFSAHEKARYAYTFLGGVFDYPYPYSPPFVIGSIYLGNAQTSANANVWADAFANFGYAGMVVTTLLLAAVFWLFDSLMSDANTRLAALMIGIPAISLASSGLPVVLLTHGLGLVLIVAFLMPLARASVPKRVGPGLPAARSGARTAFAAGLHPVGRAVSPAASGGQLAGSRNT